VPGKEIEQKGEKTGGYIIRIVLPTKEAMWHPSRRGEVLLGKHVEITIVLQKWVRMPHCYFFTQAGVMMSKSG
jgi:hypothetical protein